MRRDYEMKCADKVRIDCDFRGGADIHLVLIQIVG